MKAPTSPLTQIRRHTDRQEREIPELSDAVSEVEAPSEGIDIDRLAPNTARIVEPAHNIRRTFGLGTGSALAVTPSMIDDNELASQTVVDESEVFDDPFYEALVAVGLDDEPTVEEDAPEVDPVESDDATEVPQPDENADAEQPPAPEPFVAESAVAEDAPDEAAVETAAAKAPEAQKPESKPEPEFGLEHGSALAMVPSMIDDNLLCSELIADEAEVFDDPFFEALVAVEENDEAPAKEAEPESEAESEQTVADTPSEEAPAQPEDQPKPEPQFGLEHGSALALVPSMIDDNLLCSGLIADEAEVFDDPFLEALLAVEDEDAESKAEPEKADNEAEVETESAETDGMLYTTASTLIEEDEDDEPLRGKHARITEEPQPEKEPEAESEPESEATTEPKPELELNLEPKPVAPEEASPAAEPASDPAEPPEADSGATGAATAAEEGSDGEEAAQAESSSPADEDASTPVEDEHAAAQEPAQPVQDEAPAEKLPDDESVADAVDEMVLNSDYSDERTVTSSSSATEADGAPKKQGFWSRFRNLFRRRKS